MAMLGEADPSGSSGGHAAHRGTPATPIRSRFYPVTSGTMLSLRLLLLLLLLLPLTPGLGRAQPGPLSPQAVALLRALGLSEPPAPRQPRPVPPLLWRLFRKSQEKLAAAKETQEPQGPEQQAQPCRVEELGVPGNIVRLVPDRGKLRNQGKLLSGSRAGGGADSPQARGPPRHRLNPSRPVTRPPRAPCLPFPPGGSVQFEEPALAPLCVEKPLFFNLSALAPQEQPTLVRLELACARGAPGPGWELSLSLAPGPQLWGWQAHWHHRQLLLTQPLLPGQDTIHLDLLDLGLVGPSALPRNLSLVLEILAGGGGDGNGTEAACTSLGRSLEASLLVVTLHPQQCRPLARRRRTVAPAAPAPDRICRPHQLYVSFRDVGWHDWIIAPRGFMANYCRGSCPFPLATQLNSVNHAILQSLMHSVAPAQTPLPCCIPVRLSPISVLFYDNGDNVVLRHYEDMVVDECGCR
ncbi:embryonic growth/differentiation factor 1-like [Tachyglossus aculeatus]|uniref:embryonic growth/differentiation factor 1-like n=1 Tax=Tachyglossus aculeatus TaxID=9261 RepID=UPI0018F79052|nr:embryonic growth/differentiation factor 1-like [Tachyglossus aculeatus]